ncbi:MYXO-CTERM sorting domain-containing protein [Chondromyces crocatus]|uniref:Right handed beta helix domain-containing protein n=1 Tax=Chondromyces crocatus TaxID=52 RepID=A0A0K1EJA0_CHOCO|nr:MYXO-CTERM sorting domain-containing protein [Chondromyces crocatus]AKT40752.1 uncharacterized protein CMC5_049080 [Chondromyces crocatus]
MAFLPRPRAPRLLPLLLAATALPFVLSPRDALAADIDADPSTYETLVPTLQPGDTLHLAAGTYLQSLDLLSLNGTPEAPITITGPADKGAIFLGNGCCNTVEITASSHIVVKNLTIDGQNLPSVFGVSAKNGNANLVHHITIEDCIFRGHGGSQQTVAISTKAPTWGWIIRRNLIEGAGTGMYLGDSNGGSPFVAGLIERNLIRNPIGYALQIKHQTPWPLNNGLPTDPTTTVIRDNVFLKSDAPSPDGDRPTLLVGGFPDTGLGAQNRYEIFGNFFFHNPREAHLQASGRVSIHDNVFVDTASSALVLANHDLPLRLAHVYNNTVYGADRGIRFAHEASEGAMVVGNLLFAGQGVTGSVQVDEGNLVYTEAEAAEIVNAPSRVLGQMDFYPREGQAQGAALDLVPFAGDVDHDRDFNGIAKGDGRFRGAYAGEGTNRGWQLADDFKGLGISGEGGGSAGEGGAGGSAGGAGEGGAGAAGGSSGTDEGCGCVVAGGGSDTAPWAFALALATSLGVSRRIRRRQARHAR